MKYQLTKHKELWDKIIAHLESMDFSMGFKPFHLLYTDYCLSMGLRHESYACEYAASKHHTLIIWLIVNIVLLNPV